MEKPQGDILNGSEICLHETLGKQVIDLLVKCVKDPAFVSLSQSLSSVFNMIDGADGKLGEKVMLIPAIYQKAGELVRQSERSVALSEVEYPKGPLLDDLIAASQRGVQVKILIPQNNENKFKDHVLIIDGQKILLGLHPITRPETTRQERGILIENSYFALSYAYLLKQFYDSVT